MIYPLFTKLFVIIYGFSSFPSVTMSSGNNDRDLTFPSAQCQAICLKNYMKVKSIRAECIKSCKNIPEFCENTCNKDDVGCLEGCKYLRDIIKLHPGQCPSVVASKNEKMVGQQSCLSKCKSDSDCLDSLNKCCSVGCSNLCTESLYNNSVPQIPLRLKPSEMPNSSDIEIDWMTHYTSFISDSTPLTFVLQTRVCPCKTYNPNFVGKWQTLIITSQSGARLNAFDQGKIYQFRLAAVSPYGTRGFGPPSKPFPEKVDRPDNPTPPRALTELLSRLYSSGQISVTIGWEKADDHVLAVSEYVVKWMIDYGYVQSDGHAISALTQFTQSVPPDRVSYVLENLKPNTSYRVEVFTKIYWPGDEPLLSEPVILFLATPAINFDVNNGINYEDTDGFCKNKTLRHNNEPFSAEISKPFYLDDQVKIQVQIRHNTPSTYRVSWTPRICIDSPDNRLNREQQKTQYLQTTNNLVEIKGVMFNCRYHLTIDIVDDKSQRYDVFPRLQKTLSIDGFFCVPSCSEVITNPSTQSSSCYDHKTKLPPQPRRLTCKVLNKKSKTYRLSWSHPELVTNLKEDIFKSKYRIIWGPRHKEPINENLYGDVTGLFPIIDSTKTNVKVLNRETTSLILENLQPQTLYIIKAQLLLTLRDGQEMESDVSIHYFNTGLAISFTEDSRSSAYILNTKIIILVISLSLTFSSMFRDMY